MKKEWQRLRDKNVWGETVVREKRDVMKEAQRSGTKAHFGRLNGICVEKNSELEPSNPQSKFKGRVVFLGNRVKDENWENALFQDLGSAPATMEAAKVIDAYGCLPNHDIEQADA